MKALTGAGPFAWHQVVAVAAALVAAVAGGVRSLAPRSRWAAHLVAQRHTNVAAVRLALRVVCGRDAGGVADAVLGDTECVGPRAGVGAQVAEGGYAGVGVGVTGQAVTARGGGAASRP